MIKADYSKIADSYDRGRSISEQNSRMWLDLISGLSKAPEDSEVLDLGCGTGRFSLPMANQPGFNVTGADLSMEMLAKAREKDINGLIKWDHQNAGDLTYPDSSFDMVFISHLLHHVDSPRDVINECKRVLTPAGSIIIRYGAMEQIRDDVEHTFFPEVIGIDELRTLTRELTEKWLYDAGFINITSKEIIQQTYKTGIDHLNSARAKSTSVLNMISREAFQSGIKRFAEYVDSNPDDPWLLHDRMTLTVGYK